MKSRPAAIARPRNAAATRAAILDAARARFAQEGYDGASLRDLASDAGVDAALVCRYFGSKEELFTEVLTACAPPMDLLSGDLATFPARAAQALVDEPANAKLDNLLLVLRSASSPKAAEIIRKNNLESFYGPLESWLAGPDAAVKARAAACVMMGFAISREIDDTYMLPPDQRGKLKAKLAELLSAAIG